jgi:hypothetical protein
MRSRRRNAVIWRRLVASGTVSLRIAYDSRSAAVAGSFEKRLS